MRDIKKPPLNLVNRWQMVLVVLTILFALIAGVSFFAISSPYAPLFVFAGVIAVIALFTWLRKPIWGLYFTLFIVLLPTNLIPAEINSYINRFATIIALVVWMVDIVRRRCRILVTTSTLLMLGFTVWAAISLLWAGDQSAGIEILQKYGLRLILFLVLFVNEIRTKKEIDGLMNTLALSGGLLAVISMGTVLLQGYIPGTRLQVVGMNENMLGLSLLVTTPAVLWWSASPSKRSQPIKKWLAVLFFLISIGLIGLSGSRGTAISLGITLLAFLIWKPTRSWGILGLFIIGLAAMTIPFVFSTTISRFLLAPGETILGGRENIWPAAWQLIKDHLILGVGIGNSSHQVIPYMMNLGMWFFSADGEPLHNPIMVIWAETGLLGLLLYLGVLISAVYSFIQQYLQSRRIGVQYLLLYYGPVAAVFLGYMASWIKGGGMETDFSYFLMLALLLIPSTLKEKSFN